MTIFGTLSDNDKKRVLLLELNGAQTQLYGILVGMGIDPETFVFNSDDWGAPDVHSYTGRVAHFVQIITYTQAKIDEINASE
jgi:hypothetical protein